MANTALAAFIDRVGDRELTTEEAHEFGELMELARLTVTPENRVVCPLCGKRLAYGEPRKYETLTEHCSDPNGDYPERPTVVCTNPACVTFGRGFWACIEGGWYSLERDDDGIYRDIPDAIEPFTRKDARENWFREWRERYHRNGRIKQSLRFRWNVWQAERAKRKGAYYVNIDYREGKTFVQWEDAKRQEVG